MLPRGAVWLANFSDDGLFKFQHLFNRPYPVRTRTWNKDTIATLLPPYSRPGLEIGLEIKKKGLGRLT
jgi:hypothetical protein